MNHVTQPLAYYVANLRFEDLPYAVVSRAKLLALNLTGSVLRAGKEAEGIACFRASLMDLGWDVPGKAVVPGLGRGLSPPVAALMTGFLGRALEFDDFHPAAMVHPSAPILAAAFAVGQITGASGREVLTAIIAGYEVACRIGLSLNASADQKRGYDATAIAGNFGAIAASSRLFRLDAREIASAFQLAGSQVPGVGQGRMQGAWTKDWLVGQAAMNGVIAATLAHKGMIGARYDSFASDVGSADLGQTYETLNIGINPYPNCPYTHSALDGLAALRSEHRLQAGDIEAVRIGLHQNGIDLTAHPQTKLRSVADGQFSMAFSAAVMIKQGTFSWDDYALLSDPDIIEMASRIDIRRDVRMEGLAHPFGANLAITTAQGEFTRRVPAPSGAGDKFPKEQAVLEKFFSLATPVINSKAGALADMILGLDSIATLKDAFR